MRMGILFGRAAVRGPAGVPDAVVAFDWRRLDNLFESRQLARAPAQIDRSVPHDRDACRVVTAIFQTAQPVDQDGNDLFRPDVADDSAHI